MPKPGMVLLVASSLTAACASRGTPPGAMSAAHHDEAARVEAARAAEHLEKAEAVCPGYHAQEACYRYWTSFRNPTKKQYDEARKHRELAEQHRAASQALRDAETRECVGVPQADRDISPFLHVEDIVSVDPLPIDRKGDVLSGVRVIFRAMPEMNADWLQHVVDCHLARNAVMGYEDANKESCPLTVRGVKAFVHPVAQGLAVDIRPEDERASREVHIRTAEAARYCANPPARNQGPSSGQDQAAKPH